MTIDDSNMIDGIAYDGEILILEVYDHLGFEGEFEFDHIILLQDKLNTCLRYIESKQYLEIYPEKTFTEVNINVHFLKKITDNCKRYIDVSNDKLQSLKVTIIPIAAHENL